MIVLYLSNYRTKVITIYLSMKKFIFVILLFIMLSSYSFANYKIYLIHGYAGSSLEMKNLFKALCKEGFSCEIFNYRSMIDDLDTVSIQLYEKIKLDKVDTVSFVTHSMGSLVVRALYKHIQPNFQSPFIHRIVMIAPPNKGTTLADFWSKLGIARIIGGPNVVNMTTDTINGASKYPIPNAQIGIIAGYRGTKHGYNLLLKGDNDGIIPYENTNLPNEVDISYVKASHWAIIQKNKVIEMTINFLKFGKLNIVDISK